MRNRSLVRLVVAIAALATLASACGSDKNAASSTTAAGSGGAAATGGSGEKVTLRLGYFPNVTHGAAVYGVESGSFAKDLGADVTLKPSLFNAGPAAVTALLSDAIDASFVGPGPATSAFVKGKGAAVVVAGAASGGAFLVVKPAITSAADLKGKKISDPQLAGTQDIALRWYLKQQGYTTDQTGGGDVHVVPQENSATVTAFQNGDIDGAWVPEPYATKLVKEGGHVLVDERDLWPNKQFTTTVLIVSKKFLGAHPDTVKALVQALSNSIDAIAADPTKTADVIAAGITKGSGKEFNVSLVTESEKSITFTLDPIASSLRTVSEHSVALGLSKKADLAGIFDLTIVNDVLKAKGKPEVSGS